MKSFLAFLLGAVLGFGAHWFMSQPRSDRTVANARGNLEDTGERIKDSFNGETIKDELSRTGQVIREKTRKAGVAISDATANARITGSIKAKLLQERASTALAIDVDTTDGVVTLSGTVPSHDEIVKAMNLAMETDGVHKVVSTLQVKAPAAAEAKNEKPIVNQP